LELVLPDIVLSCHAAVGCGNLLGDAKPCGLGYFWRY
jgi:hypothetical protein